MRTTINSYFYITLLFAIAVFFSSCDSSVTDSKSDHLPESEISKNSVIETAMSGTAADVEFKVIEISHPPYSGSVGVWYEGEKVSTPYSSSSSRIDVAINIVSNINNDPDIQLTASLVSYSDSRVLLTEKRVGSQYNGNPVYVTHSLGSHISVNGYEFFMGGGTD